MPIDISIVDAFTKHPFTGNPAAVCCLENDLSDTVKQKIAAEMNLSDTAFVTLTSDSSNFSDSFRFGLRWFTPTNEVPLCGHATLASAAVIFHHHGNKAETIEFETLSGILTATQSGIDGITLNFPLNASSPYEGNLKELVNLSTGELIVKDIQLSPTTKKLLLRLEDNYTRDDLERLAPSIDRMTSIETGGAVKGIIVTVRAKEGDDYDFYSRYFAPWVGIPEDPVTGSAHTVLAPYWQKILGKSKLQARQCSKRGGDLTIEIVDQRVRMTGSVAFVLQGTLNI